MIFNMTGGGAPLNFQVVGGTTQPNNPKENTIWVDTDAEITGWAFSSETPNNPIEGMVLITTATQGSISFNALKKNAVMISPIGAMQYVSGVWIGKTAQIYQNGEWMDWDVYLFHNGNQYTELTGGWTGAGYTDRYGTYSETPGTVGEVISLASSSKTNVGIVGTDKMIDLTNYNTLRVVLTEASDAGVVIAATTTKVIGNDGAAYVLVTTPGEKTIDISELNGLYYIVFSVWGSVNFPQRAMVVSSAWLE